MSTIAFPSVPYAFSPLSNQFTGEGPTFLEGQGSLILQVLVDPVGDFKSGHLQFRGAQNELLLLAELDGPPVVMDTQGLHFFLQFPLEILTEHLPGAFQTGRFEAFVCNPAGGQCGDQGPTTAEELFTTAYTDAAVSLNSYLRLTELAPVPAPDFLIAAGCVLALVVRRWWRP